MVWEYLIEFAIAGVLSLVFSAILLIPVAQVIPDAYVGLPVLWVICMGLYYGLIRIKLNLSSLLPFGT